jgi:hypothetical protein
MAALAVLAPAALAATPTNDIGSAGGPLTHVFIGNDFSCQVNHTGDTSNEFYPPGTVPGDCGTFLAVAATLYGPDFQSHGTTATGDLNGGTGDTLFSGVSQSAVTGSGTSSSPRQVVTSGDAGSSGLHVSQTDGYVDGAEYYRTDVTVSNSTGSPITATLFHAADCFLQNSDSGFGWFDSASQSIFCTENPNNSPTGRIVGFQPLTSGSHYTETMYSTVWSQITQSGAQFPDSCDCTTQEDNGAGLSWAITVPANGSTTVSFLSTFSPTGALADQPITATGASVSATEGQSFSGTVATFSDPDTSATASEYSATIDWGDGSTSAGTISGSGGNFTVSGTPPHTYAEEGSFAVKVTITDVDNTSNTATTSSTATVADAALTAKGTTVSAVEGASTTQTVATFTDADPAGTVSDYTATINWGDGSTSTGTIAASGSGFKVSGTHTYAEEGTDAITVTIKDVGGATASATSTAKVADAPLSSKGVSKTTPRAFTGTVATFTDQDPNGTASDYTVSISWGDGQTSGGSVSGKFNALGSHAYAKAGVYHVSVTIKDKGGSTTTGHSTLTVKVKANVVAGLHITHVSASPIKPGCETELRAVIAAGRCGFGNMTIRGTIRKKARGNVHVTVFVPLLTGPVHGTARIVRGHWQLTLKVAGINKDNPEPIYKIQAKFNGSPGVRSGKAKKRVRYESELHDLGPA